ncbi:hypothetical protein V8E51_019445 [Hyaloscypha variabilis]
MSTAEYGEFVFGPVIDDDFVPALPSTLLSQRKFVHDLKVMTGYNTNDGFIFSSPLLQNSSDFQTYPSSFLPAFNKSIISEITTLYPPTTNLTGTSDEGAPVNATVAEALQGYLVDFAMWENPNGKGLPGFPVYGEEAMMLNINITELGSLMKDKADNERCSWWQQVLSDLSRQHRNCIHTGPPNFSCSSRRSFRSSTLSIEMSAHGYKVSFGICAAAIVWNFRRIRRERIKAEKTGRLFVEDDIKVFYEREFFSKTLKKGKDNVEVV